DSCKDAAAKTVSVVEAWASGSALDRDAANRTTLNSTGPTYPGQFSPKARRTATAGQPGGIQTM
ncbi:MAG: hypothetical protein KF812_13465, partial [Fimbriimonadaceae bacterium]|nr:hypothetical protein [Fimbriimonadaceae bacterium]